MSDIFFGAEENLKGLASDKPKKQATTPKKLSTIESLNLGNVSRELSMNSGDKGLCKIRPKAIVPSSHNPRPDWTIDDEWLKLHVLVDFDDVFENEIESTCLVKIEEVEDESGVVELVTFPSFVELNGRPEPKSEKDYNFLVALAKSIREVGQVQPIEVETNHEKGGFVVLEGHLRRLACILGRMPYIDAVRNEGLHQLSDASKVERQITENSIRKNLSPFGIFKLASHFVDQNPKISSRELADKLKITQTYSAVYKKVVINRAKLTPLLYIAIEKDLLSQRGLREVVSQKSIKSQEKVLHKLLGTDYIKLDDNQIPTKPKSNREGRKRTVSTFRISTKENCIKAGNKLITIVPTLSDKCDLQQVNSVEDMDKLLDAFVLYLLEE
jgi:hypothetical protein